MKTPREILLERHQAAEPKLDRIRAELIAQDSLRPATARRVRFFSTLNLQLSTLLWPHPRAWAGLAGVWVLIFALHVASDGGSKAAAVAEPVRSPEVIAILQEQRRLLAEFFDRAEPRDADRRNLRSLPPRSERRGWYCV
jgi:hypothetical protein